MNNWTLDISKEKYDKILTATRFIECLIHDPANPAKQYNRIAPGDNFYFNNTNKDNSNNDFNNKNINPAVFKVTFMQRYDSIEDMVKYVGLTNSFPLANSIEDALKIYTKQELKSITQYGIYAVHLRKKNVYDDSTASD